MDWNLTRADSLHARIIRIQNFLGIVANDEWAAVRAAKSLKTTWSESQTLPGSDMLDRHVRASAVERDETLVNRGDPAAALAVTAKQLSATYWWPFQSHASLGPSCATVDFRPEGTTIWSASQGPHGLRANFARVFGIAEDKLRVIFLDGSGSYGSNGNDDAAADALLLSRAVGKPVRKRSFVIERTVRNMRPQLLLVAHRRPQRGAVAGGVQPFNPPITPFQHDRPRPRRRRCSLGHTDVAARECAGQPAAARSR